MQHHSRRFGLGYLLYGVGLGWWSLTIAPGALSVLRFSTLGLVQLPTQRTLLLCGVVALLTGVWCVVSTPASRCHAVSLGINVFGMVCSILVWASMHQRQLASSLLTAHLTERDGIRGLCCVQDSAAAKSRG